MLGRTSAAMRSVDVAQDEGRAPWRAHVDELFAVIEASRARRPTCSQIAAIVEAEASGVLPAEVRRRIAGRIARAIAEA